nr:hypothetical protein [Tanacetum cinerariifolium]
IRDVLLMLEILSRKFFLKLNISDHRLILMDLQETLKRRWRYLVLAESHIHNCMLISNYQDIKYQDFCYSDELLNLGRYEHVSPMSLEQKVVFTKADESSSVLAPEITSDSEYDCDSQEPLPPLPKLIGAVPSSISESLISLSDLTLNMVDLTLHTPEPKKTRPSVKVSPAYVIKKKMEKLPAGPKPCSDKKADSSTEQFFLLLWKR